jgi:hypothetical protein
MNPIADSSGVESGFQAAQKPDSPKARQSRYLTALLDICSGFRGWIEMMNEVEKLNPIRTFHVI